MQWTNEQLIHVINTPSQYDETCRQIARELLKVRVRDPEPGKYCEKARQWAQACMTELESDSDHKKMWREEFRKHWEFLAVAAHKSNLLGRMLYGQQELRIEQCLTHKGKWSGLDDGKCKCNNTGWLPNVGTES